MTTSARGLFGSETPSSQRQKLILTRSSLTISMASHGIDAPAPAIFFAFEGGDADQQQPNFYDASRFQYAAARLIYTLEHFRQTGRVLERIHAKVQADYRVSSPRPGSWVLDVVLVNSLPLAQMLIQVPIDIMLAYVIDRLIPANKPRSIALEIERERTAQSREETRRHEIMAQSNAIALNALSRALDASQVHQDRLVQALEARSELQAARDRSLSLRAHNDELNDKIDDNMEAQLMSITRGQVVEMGKPLLRSAEDLVIGGANVRGNLAYKP